MSRSDEIKARATRRAGRTGGFSYTIDLTPIGGSTEELDKQILNANNGAIQRLHNAANANLRASIKRPVEQGQGIGGRRQTGRFTFGGSGTFVGFRVKQNGGDTQGFAWPDLERADRRTDYVWRSLEWGLGSARMNVEFASKGAFRFPNIAGWWDGSRVRGGDYTRIGQDVLRPGSTAGGRLAGGQGRGRRQGRVVALPRPDLAIEPKLFLTNAWNSVIPDVEQKYQDIASGVSSRFFG